ncbi:MAG TPA: hypothetical protein VGR21_01120, partial [Cryptosporangiaceae bacterium]|nr:hypothetical protein [Cryptosporangiaceae bacterium]
ALIAQAADHAFNTPGYPTPYELSRAGWDGKARGPEASWLGKRAILGKAWKGVKWIAPASGTAPLTVRRAMSARAELPPSRFGKVVAAREAAADGTRETVRGLSGQLVVAELRARATELSRFAELIAANDAVRRQAVVLSGTLPETADRLDDRFRVVRPADRFAQISAEMLALSTLAADAERLAGQRLEDTAALLAEVEEAQRGRGAVPDPELVELATRAHQAAQHVADLADVQARWATSLERDVRRLRIAGSPSIHIQSTGLTGSMRDLAGWIDAKIARLANAADTVENAVFHLLGHQETSPERHLDEASRINDAFADRGEVLTRAGDLAQVLLEIADEIREGSVDPAALEGPRARLDVLRRRLTDAAQETHDRATSRADLAVAVSQQVTDPRADEDLAADRDLAERATRVRRATRFLAERAAELRRWADGIVDAVGRVTDDPDPDLDPAGRKQAVARKLESLGEVVDAAVARHVAETRELNDAVVGQLVDGAIDEDITASAVPDSDEHGKSGFHGQSGRFRLLPTRMVRREINRQLDRIARATGMEITQVGPNRYQVRRPGEEPFTVRVRVGDTGSNVAQSTVKKRHVDVTFSRTPRRGDVGRAMAHEIAEAAALLDGAPRDGDVFTAEREATGPIDPARLTGHDHGRLAELTFLRDQLVSGNPLAKRRARKHEIGPLLAHMGLVAPVYDPVQKKVKLGSPGFGPRFALLDVDQRQVAMAWAALPTGVPGKWMYLKKGLLMGTVPGLLGAVVAGGVLAAAGAPIAGPLAATLVAMALFGPTSGNLMERWHRKVEERTKAWEEARTPVGAEARQAVDDEVRALAQQVAVARRRLEHNLEAVEEREAAQRLHDERAARAGSRHGLLGR